MLPVISCRIIVGCTMRRWAGAGVTGYVLYVLHTPATPATEMRTNFHEITNNNI